MTYGGISLIGGLIVVDVCSHGDAFVSRPYWGHVAVFNASSGAALPFWYDVPIVNPAGYCAWREPAAGSATAARPLARGLRSRSFARADGAGIWGTYAGFVTHPAVPGYGFVAAGNGSA